MISIAALADDFLDGSFGFGDVRTNGHARSLDSVVGAGRSRS